MDGADSLARSVQSMEQQAVLQQASPRTILQSIYRKQL